MANPRKPDGPGDPHITIRIESTSGNTTARLNPMNKANKILEIAYDEIGLNPSPPRPYVMTVERTGRTLDPTQKLAPDVEDGDTVVIQERQPIDG